jgi:hypothetical protein
VLEDIEHADEIEGPSDGLGDAVLDGLEPCALLGTKMVQRRGFMLGPQDLPELRHHLKVAARAATDLEYPPGSVRRPFGQVAGHRRGDDFTACPPPPVAVFDLGHQSVFLLFHVLTSLRYQAAARAYPRGFGAARAANT